jgi:hypothetical protein
VNNVTITCDALTLAALLLPKAFADQETGMLDLAIRDKVETLRAVLLAEIMQQNKLVDSFIALTYNELGN